MSAPVLPATRDWYSADTAEAQQRVVAAWKDAPVQNAELLGTLLEIAKEQVLEYAPIEEPAVAIRRLLDGYGYMPTVIDAALGLLALEPDIEVEPPARYVWAQLQHAKHLWNAGRVNSNGQIGPDGFTFAPRPLDRDIQAIIRPRSGVVNVF